MWYTFFIISAPQDSVQQIGNKRILNTGECSEIIECICTE